MSMNWLRKVRGVIIPGCELRPECSIGLMLTPRQVRHVSVPVAGYILIAFPASPL